MHLTNKDTAEALRVAGPMGNVSLVRGLPLFSMFRPLVVCFPVSAVRCCHQVSSKHGRYDEAE